MAISTLNKALISTVRPFKPHTGADLAILWSFAVIFLFEAALLVLNLGFSHWTWNLSLERNVPTYLHSGMLAAVFLSLVATGVSGQSKFDSVKSVAQYRLSVGDPDPPTNWWSG